jgi:hypothetical protein
MIFSTMERNDFLKGLDGVLVTKVDAFDSHL